jgi:hypothetical protein
MLGLGGGAFGPPGQLTGDPPHHGLGFVAGLSCRSHSFAPISRARVPAQRLRSRTRLQARPTGRLHPVGFQNLTTGVDLWL